MEEMDLKADSNRRSLAIGAVIAVVAGFLAYMPATIIGIRPAIFPTQMMMLSIIMTWSFLQQIGLPGLNKLNKRKKLMCRKAISSIFLILVPAFDWISVADACTIGVAHGSVTSDGRPIVWRVHDTPRVRDIIRYVKGSPYNYLTILVDGKWELGGLNEAGVAATNSHAWDTDSSCNNRKLQSDILANCNSLDQIRDYIKSQVKAGLCRTTGCFAFIDATGNASMFEISHSDWYREYDSINPNRKTHGLYGFIVRANEFHKRSDGTDDPKIKGRYYSGNYNILGLIGINKLNTDAIIQGTDGTNGFEFVRYGPGRALKSISRSTTTNATIVQGVASGEDTALATMWVILGQSNYGIAVPAWVKVRDIPKCLANGDMFDRAKSLYNKGDEAITQASVFPVEAHIFKMVNNRLLPHWRTSGVPSVAEMSRVEHQIANDAFSLLDCLDNTQRDNKAPGVTLIASPNGFTINFGAIVKDSDGTIKGIEWNFGDEITSAKPSPSHTYAEAGTYLVSVTVTDDDGVSITDWNYFTVPDYSGSNQQRPSDDAWNQACDISDPNGDIIDYKDMAVFTANWLVGVE